MRKRKMITSKLAAKARTTIPKAVREALGSEEGDEIADAIEDGRVILTKAGPQVSENPSGVFYEWEGEADRMAYGGKADC